MNYYDNFAQHPGGGIRLSLELKSVNHSLTQTVILFESDIQVENTLIRPEPGDFGLITGWQLQTSYRNMSTESGYPQQLQLDSWLLQDVVVAGAGWHDVNPITSVVTVERKSEGYYVILCASAFTPFGDGLIPLSDDHLPTDMPLAVHIPPLSEDASEHEYPGPGDDGDDEDGDGDDGDSSDDGDGGDGDDGDDEEQVTIVPPVPSRINAYGIIEINREQVEVNLTRDILLEATI
ncbi:MAG: hypothetical protein FWD27_00665 [Coriobacteriia bacterium]|nr:hypothetical protein [Coriobacteriia bacterium]